MEYMSLCIKYFLLILNAVCGIFGLIVISAGAIFIDGFRDEKWNWNLVAIALIVCITMYYGFIGSYQENSSAIWAYFLNLIICISLQSVAMDKCQTNDLVKMVGNKTESLWSKELIHVGSMTVLERQYGCCGLHNINDYIVNNVTVPQSCYRYANRNNPNLFFNVGCWDKTVQAFTYYENCLKAINAIFLVFEIIALISTWFLARRCKQYAVYRDSI